MTETANVRWLSPSLVVKLARCKNIERTMQSEGRDGLVKQQRIGINTARLARSGSGVIGVTLSSSRGALISEWFPVARGPQIQALMDRRLYFPIDVVSGVCAGATDYLKMKTDSDPQVQNGRELPVAEFNLTATGSPILPHSTDTSAGLALDLAMELLMKPTSRSTISAFSAELAGRRQPAPQGWEITLSITGKAAATKDYEELRRAIPEKLSFGQEGREAALDRLLSPKRTIQFAPQNTR